MKNMLQRLITILVVAVLILSLIYIDEVKEGVISAIENCLIGIIPSLFLNSVLATVLIKLSSSMKLKRISTVDYGVIMAFLLGNICGYPIGAKILSELVKDITITSERAEKAICFSYASGPAYILGIVSTAVFHAKLLGFTAFISIFMSNMVLFIFYMIRYKHSETGSLSCEGVSLNSAVMQAIGSAADSMISICSAIVFFSALISLLPSLNPAVAALLEISNITSLQGSGMQFFIMSTVLLSFGGLCVHMQIICLAGSSFNFKWFYLTRPIQLLLTAAFSALGYLLVQNYIIVETGTAIELSSTGSVVPFICTVGMVLIALTHKKSDRT